MSKNQTQITGRIIGIDLHPRCFAAAGLKNSDNILWVHKRVELNDLEKWLNKNLNSTDTLVIEAGSNSKEFAKRVTEYGVPCLILDSVKVGKISKSYLKHDKDDAVKIAKVYLSGLADGIWRPDHKTNIRRQVLIKYNQCNKSITKHKNMIRSFLTEHMICVPKGFALFSLQGQEWAEKAYEWDSLQLELIDIMYKALRDSEELKDRLRKAIAKDVINDSRVLALTKLCGVRTITAFALAAAIGDIARFPNHKKLSAYLGLVPTVKQSGDNIRYGGIGRAGRKETRSFLIQGAQSIFAASDEYGGKFKKWAINKSFQKGRNIAVAAVARKLSVAVWYSMRGKLTNVHIPEKSMESKMQKLVRELGVQTIKSLGYKNSREFKEEIKAKLLNTA